MSISPKVLNMILEKILSESGLWERCHLYVDDLLVERKDVQKVRKTLALYGFECKDPIPLSQARVLGLQLKAVSADSDECEWTKWDGIPEIPIGPGQELPTRREILSWRGQLLAHQPIGGWIRCAVQMLARLAAARSEPHEPELQGLSYGQRRRVRNRRFDKFVSPAVYEACKKLLEEIKKRGSPVKGSWSFDVSKEWIVYTDASSLAKGALLQIGGVAVEDVSALRAIKDVRHINESELEALFLGLSLASKYRTVLLGDSTENLSVRFLCDNQSVVAWMEKASAGLISPVGGANYQHNTKTVQKLLKLAADSRIKMTVEYCPGGQNLADPLSRVPDCFREAIAELAGKDHGDSLMGLEVAREEEGVVAAIIVNPDSMETEVGQPQEPMRERDASGLTVPRDEIDLRKFLENLHRCACHPGADAFDDLARRIVKFEGLASLCKLTVANCEACKACKGGYLPQDGAAMFKLRDNSKGKVTGGPEGPQWQAPIGRYILHRGHMDIAGPLFDTQYGYITVVIDSYSSYAWSLYTTTSPGSKELIGLIEGIRLALGETFDELVTDNGPQMTSAQFREYLRKSGTQHIQTPVYSSWYNGKVERFFRTIEDRLRAGFYGKETVTDKEFAASVERVVRVFNVTSSKGHYYSPSEVIRGRHFPWFFNEPEMRDWRPTSNEIAEQESSDGERKIFTHLHARAKPFWNLPENLSPQQLKQLDKFPKPGERWLAREHSPVKFDQRFVWVDILEVITPTTFKVVYASSRTVRVLPLKVLRRPQLSDQLLPDGLDRQSRHKELLKRLEDPSIGVRFSHRGRIPKRNFDDSLDILGNKVPKIGRYVPPANIPAPDN
jgi:hypothetical protein